MKKVTIFMLFLFFTGIMFSQTVLSTDPMHSRMEFKVTHMLVNDVTGTFDDAIFEMNRNNSDFTKSQLTFIAKVSSINTRVEARDTHLKSADFFEADKYPTITFKSKEIEEIARNVYNVTGDINIHGVTKPITATLYYNGSAKNQEGQTIEGYKVKAELSRSDFGIGSKYGPAIISDEVYITGDFELLKK
ncbi:polyisoprenoid-binding protein [Flavobacteriaceae bacterium Ap0902]|nr:polyisoprenoid-binding protein [Flavobacteriaceae bacterium Ap0902]